MLIIINGYLEMALLQIQLIPEHTFDNAGNYSVTLIAFNKNGCADTIVRNDIIQLGPPKILGIENIPYQGLCTKNYDLSAQYL